MPKEQNIGEPRGTNDEKKVFTDVEGHYTMAKEDLTQRTTRKNGFDDADKMFASYIDEKSWPFKSIIFDPRPYTVILEKSARLIGGKPKGRLVPREGGDNLGARINNELLSYQWEDNTRLGESMISKWIMMDQNARKYGSAFALAKWNYSCRTVKDDDGKATKEVTYDGPDMIVCNPRDVLANPSYTYINKWFQHREYVTLQDLTATNDASRSKPVYKNLDILKDAMTEQAKAKGDVRSTETTNKNKSMRGLTDYMGRDEVYKTIEIVTEYRPDRWITFCPRHGVVIRDIPNPYKHGQIPVVQLKYYPLPDDLYGVNEYEPVAKLIRGLNAFLSQFSDDQAARLYPPLMVNPVNVRMHTLEFTPEAKWLMNNPGQDVVRFESGDSTIPAFNTIYNTYVAAILSAWGESSQGVSQQNPTQDAGRVTATEIKDTAYTRNVRDNMNQIFLSEAIKKQTLFWHQMNQQLLFKGKNEQNKIIRIVGRDAVDYFNRQGLGDVRPTQEDAQLIASGQMQPEEIAPGPRFAVPMGDSVEPKFQPDITGEGGNLIVEPGDLMGSYDYIPDIETMKAPSNEQIEQKLTAVLGTITNPAIMQMLAAEGKRPKVSELLVQMFESTNVIKDAEAYFEPLPPPTPMNVQPNNSLAGGGTPPAAGTPDQGNGGDPGLAGSVPTMA